MIYMILMYNRTFVSTVVFNETTHISSNISVLVGPFIIPKQSSLFKNDLTKDTTMLADIVFHKEVSQFKV